MLPKCENMLTRISRYLAQYYRAGRNANNNNKQHESASLESGWQEIKNPVVEHLM